jgi:hypothetical protein
MPRLDSDLILGPHSGKVGIPICLKRLLRVQVSQADDRSVANAAIGAKLWPSAE